MNQNDLDPVLNQTGNRYGNGSLDGVSIHWYPAPDCNGKTSDQIAAAMFTNVWDWGIYPFFVLAFVYFQRLA